jgi:hypothetical protein
VNKLAQPQVPANVFGRAVNLLAYAFGGSNPPLSTTFSAVDDGGVVLAALRITLSNGYGSSTRTR